MDGEATDQEFLDFIGSPEGQQYLNEYGGAAQGVNGSLFSWSVGRGVGSALGWLSDKTNVNKGAVSVVEESFKNLGNLENRGILYSDKQLRSNGFEFVGRTPGGYYKYYNSNGAKVQIRPNGQLWQRKKYYEI
jgi:hypothetical protein